MKLESFASCLIKNELLLEQCFMEFAMTGTHSAPAFLEIARKHRENRTLLEKIQEEDRFPAFTDLQFGTDTSKIEKLLTILAKSNENESQTISYATVGNRMTTKEITNKAKVEIVITKAPANTILQGQNTSPGMHRKGYRKSKKTNLVVKFADGTIIQNSTARDTFVKALETMGIDKVKHLGIMTCGDPLVSDHLSQKPKYAAQQASCKGFYVFTYTSTEKKKELLEKIAQRLGFRIQAIIVND